MPVASSSKLVQQRLGVFKIGCAEPFNEPAVDRREQVARRNEVAECADIRIIGYSPHEN